MLAAENPEILLSYASKFLLVHLNYNIIMCYYSSSSFVLSSWKWQDQYRLIKSWKIWLRCKLHQRCHKSTAAKRGWIKRGGSHDNWTMEACSGVWDLGGTLLHVWTKIQDREQKMKQAKQQFKSRYDPAIMQCIGGSASETERVWSMAGHIMSEHPASLSPQYLS
jgi:hypothetical protein